MGRYILALDQGTTSSRAILFGEDQTIAGVTITADSVRGEGEPIVEHDAQRPPRPSLGAATLRKERGGTSARGNVS